MTTRLLIAVVLLLTLGGACVISGPALVVDQPERADAIVVLGGDHNDIRYYRGLSLLRAGYGNLLLLDASEAGTFYGRTPAEYAAEFVKTSSAEFEGRVIVCPYMADSTVTETLDVDRCMQKVQAHSGLLVTSPPHTRRALSVFSLRLPQYRWSVTAAEDKSDWSPHWWMRRQWAKTHLAEWERMIWWQAVDRWRD